LKTKGDDSKKSAKRRKEERWAQTPHTRGIWRDVKIKGLQKKGFGK